MFAKRLPISGTQSLYFSTSRKRTTSRGNTASCVILRGRLPIFIRNFLRDRTFKVRLGSTYSDSFEQEEGYPQGSIMSILLFLIKIDAVKQFLNARTDGSLFVDDLSVSCRGRNMAFIERNLQHVINALSRWALENGFKFSTSKTVCVHFCKRRGICLDPALTLDHSPIPVVPSSLAFISTAASASYLTSNTLKPDAKKLSIFSASWLPAAGVQTARLSLCCTEHLSGQSLTTAVSFTALAASPTWLN